MLTPSRTAGRTCYDVGVTQVCRGDFQGRHFNLESRLNFTAAGVTDRLAKTGAPGETVCRRLEWQPVAHRNERVQREVWVSSALFEFALHRCHLPYVHRSTPSFDQTAGGFRGAGESRTGSANPRFGFVPPQTFSSTRLPAWVDNEPISVTRPVSRAAREARATTASSPYRDGSAGGVGSPGGRGGFAADAAHASVAGYGSPGLFSSGAFGAASVSAPRPGTAVPGPRGGAALSSTHASTLSPASPHRSLAFPGSAAFAVSGVLGACA